MKILIACEESQRVCAAFRRHEINGDIYSCDIQPCSGDHPEWHIQDDVIPLLNGNCEFKTQDGTVHYISGRWDLIIAHPPCTYLCRSGQHLCNIGKYGDKAIQRMLMREEAVEFFMKFIHADCDHIVVENPVGIMSVRYRKPDQYIHPNQFGHPVDKKTGLWIKGLPCLVPTNIVDIEFCTSKTGKVYNKWFYDSGRIYPQSERSKYRSRTPEGIADAMADQWYPLILMATQGTNRQQEETTFEYQRSIFRNLLAN